MGRRGAPYARGVALRQKAIDCAELLVAQFTNILWKKVQRNELLKQEAFSLPAYSRAPKSSSCR